MNVTSYGRPYLGAAIGSREYSKTYVESKTNEWLSNVKCLADIALTQPHAAYSALTHGLMTKWTYLSRTTPDIGPLLRPIDDAIRSDLIPALTGRPPPSDLQCTLFALPARFGGLGISIPSRAAADELQSSLLVTSTLRDHILSQDPQYGPDIISKQLELKKSVRERNHAKNLAEANQISETLPNQLQSALDLSRAWLHTSQGGLSGCPSTTIWLDPCGYAIQMRLWEQFLHGARYVLCQGWIPLNQAQ